MELTAMFRMENGHLNTPPSGGTARSSRGKGKHHRSGMFLFDSVPGQLPGDMDKRYGVNFQLQPLFMEMRAGVLGHWLYSRAGVMARAGFRRMGRENEMSASYTSRYGGTKETSSPLY